MQRGPEHLGESVSVVFVSGQADRVAQLGEGCIQLSRCVLGGETQSGRTCEHRIVNGRVVVGEIDVGVRDVG